MQIRRFLRRTSLVLVCAVALAPAPRAASGERPPVPATRALAALAEVRGGWVPRHLNACALGAGLMYGGLVGMSINPLGGATAFAIGVGMTLFAC